MPNSSQVQSETNSQLGLDPFKRRSPRPPQHAPQKWRNRCREQADAESLPSIPPLQHHHLLCSRSNTRQHRPINQCRRADRLRPSQLRHQRLRKKFCGRNSAGELLAGELLAGELLAEELLAEELLAEELLAEELLAEELLPAHATRCFARGLDNRPQTLATLATPFVRTLLVAGVSLGEAENTAVVALALEATKCCFERLVGSNLDLDGHAVSGRGYRAPVDGWPS